MSYSIKNLYFLFNDNEKKILKTEFRTFPINILYIYKILDLDNSNRLCSGVYIYS